MNNDTEGLLLRALFKAIEVTKLPSLIGEPLTGTSYKSKEHQISNLKNSGSKIKTI